MHGCQQPQSMLCDQSSRRDEKTGGSAVSEVLRGGIYEREMFVLLQMITRAIEDTGIRFIEALGE